MKASLRRPVRYVRLMLPAVGALLALLIVLGLFSDSAGDEQTADLLARYRKADKPSEPARGDAPSAKAKSSQDEQAERLAKQNPFAKPKSWSVKLTGVLGDKAYFAENNQGLAAGQDINGAKILQIGPDCVQIEREGRQQWLYVFEGGGGPPAMAMPGGGSRPLMIPAGARLMPVPSGPIVLPPGAIEQFKSMPPEMREKVLQQAPPEIKEQILKAM